MKRMSIIFLALTALALSGFVTAPPARAADAPAAVLFGSVDLQKIESGYSKKAAYDQQLQQLQQKLGGYLQQQGSFAMLSKADQTQLGVLLAKPAPTAQDTAQINALEAKSTQAAQQLTTLQQEQNPAQADKDQMAQLTQLQKDGQAALQDQSTAYQAQVQQESDQLSQQFAADVKTAISAVARQRGLAVVFDSQVALYTANDITDDVLKTLNK